MSETATVAAMPPATSEATRPTSINRTLTPDNKKQEKALASPRKSGSGDSSPKKAPTPKNGVPSPSKTGRTPSSEPVKKIPPIKAPVGQVPPPNVKNVKSKIGSLDNMKYKPGGGEKKVTTQKLDWKVESKVGSMDNAGHKAGGGEKKIQSVKLEFKEKASSKVGSRELINHQPKGGNVKVESQKLDFKDKATSRVGSMDNVKHKAGGGNVQVKTDKLNFKEKATAKIGSLSGGSEKGSAQNSNPQSPVPVVSPTPNDSPALNPDAPVKTESIVPNAVSNNAVNNKAPEEEEKQNLTAATNAVTEVTTNAVADVTPKTVADVTPKAVADVTSKVVADNTPKANGTIDVGNAAEAAKKPGNPESEKSESKADVAAC